MGVEGGGLKKGKWCGGGGAHGEAGTAPHSRLQNQFLNNPYVDNPQPLRQALPYGQRGVDSARKGQKHAMGGGNARFMEGRCV